METESDAERVIKQAIHKIEVDWGNLTVDMAGVLRILQSGSRPHAN